MVEQERYPIEQLTSFSGGVFKALEVPDADAHVVADCMMMAHQRGFDTHGLPCLKGYVDGLKEGRINCRPLISVDKPTLWSFCLDADNGLGQVAAHKAMSKALQAADELGVGSAVVKRSNHFGAASAYSLMALEHDCIGIVCSNASAVTAPFGAAQPLLGTNPLSVAVPAGQLPPFVIDMATSEGARKKVKQALEREETIPSGWALDKQGEPTVDPAQALEGVMLPFGGMKGSAIAILLDMLSGVLSGANYGGDVLSVFTNQEQESDNGNFFLVLKIKAFMPEETFKARMDDELNRIRSLKPARGFSEVIYPGLKESAIQADRLQNGVPLERRLTTQLAEIAKELGVDTPW
jgi:LDH2 family malate/lactate/ureidoglycolate dehydrogenase